MAHATEVPKKLRQSRERRDLRPGGGIIKKRPGFGTWPEDSTTYKKDEAAVQTLVKKQKKLAQIHDRKSLVDKEKPTR